MTVLLAVLADLLLGDPPNRLHPTAWMGSFIAFAGRFRPQHRPWAEFLYGAALVSVGVALTAGLGLALTALAALLPWPLGLLATALMLKTTFAVRGLDRAAADIQGALEAGDLPGARRWLAWHLVSRDTSQLNEAQVTAATIESVAENTSDSLVAPLLAFALGGLPLALAYRFVNTADAMLGYRDARREWYGKTAARLDDLFNLIPARVTGALVVLAGVAAGSGGDAWRIMWRDAGLTASPNAGVPMAAMAGALSIALDKVDHYVLGAGLATPVAGDLRRARRLFAMAAGLAVALTALLAGLRGM